MSLHDTMKRLLTPALVFAPLLALAQAPATPALTPEQTASIIQQLDQIEATITKNRGEALGMALTRFRSAMGGDKEAIDLYLASTKLENFDRKDLKTTDFQEWRDRNEGRFKDPEFPIGLRLQLEYLVLSIQAQDIKEAKDYATAVASLQAYLPKAIGAVQASMKHSASGAVEEKNPRRGGGGGGGVRSQLLNTLRQPVKGTIFSQAYQLNEYLTKKEWEYSPLNVGGIYESVIFPYYLGEKPEELPAQWDNRINAELAIQKCTMSESEFQHYYKETHPNFVWAKASYLLRNRITPVMAMADMLKVVRENPTHPKAPEWVKQLRQAVNETQNPIVPTSSETEPEPETATAPGAAAP
jgi:hypothetical protein